MFLTTLNKYRYPKALRTHQARYMRFILESKESKGRFTHVTKGCEENDSSFVVVIVGSMKTMTKREIHITS